jgi:GntR family transcriptional regulator, transcriptional repressor for pyruvate dehydrogenase complex
LIHSQEYPVGSRLPPERDLARQLGVSRPSVREALIALEVEGLIDVRVGSGIYVLGPPANGESDDLVHAAMGPFELLRARRVIEGECAGLAAKAAKRPQIAAIHEALHAMRRTAEDGKHPPLVEDRLFHLRIAEATGNGALVAVVKLLWEERMGPLFKRLGHHHDNPKTWGAAVDEHCGVVDAISRRDAEGARDAMHRHLDRAYRRFSKNWDAPSDARHL